MDPQGLLHRLVQLHALLFATYTYCVIVVRPLRPGWPRLLASVPAFIVFSISPFFVKDSALLSSGVGLTIMWVANFKLLAYTGGRGALSHPGLRSGLQWGALLVLPFFPAKRGRAPAKASMSSVVLGLLLKTGVYLGLTALLVAVELSSIARHLVYAVHFWMFISLCLDSGMPLGRHLVAGIPLQPAMDAPYYATSVREFWGRRYNQIVSATLQETIYKPIVEGRWVSEAGIADRVSPPPAAEGVADGNVAVRAGPPAPAPAAPAEAEGKVERRRTPMPLALVGLGASFVVSGIMHEICLWFSCGCRLEGSFRMTGFFLLQPLLILAQDAATAAAARLVPERIRSSRAAAALSTMVTLALVLGSAEWFWGSMESCGVDKAGLGEVAGAVEWLVARARASGLIAQ